MVALRFWVDIDVESIDVDLVDERAWRRLSRKLVVGLVGGWSGPKEVPDHGRNGIGRLAKLVVEAERKWSATRDDDAFHRRLACAWTVEREPGWQRDEIAELGARRVGRLAAALAGAGLLDLDQRVEGVDALVERGQKAQEAQTADHDEHPDGRRQDELALGHRLVRVGPVSGSGGRRHWVAEVGERGRSEDGRLGGRLIEVLFVDRHAAWFIRWELVSDHLLPVLYSLGAVKGEPDSVKFIVVVVWMLQIR